MYYFRNDKWYICFKEKQFKLYNVNATDINNSIITIVNNIDIETIKQYSIGTGAEEFNKFYKNCSQKNIPYCFKEFIKTDLAKEKATGGYITKAFAGYGSFKYYAEISNNNYDLLQINNAQIGGFSFIPYVDDDYTVSMTMNPFLG